jgi:hypothetical protein
VRKKRKEEYFLKCPVCGRLATPEKLGFDVNYPLELKVRWSEGRARIRWAVRGWEEGEKQNLAQMLYWRLVGVAEKLRVLAEGTPATVEIPISALVEAHLPEKEVYVMVEQEPQLVDVRW